MTCLPSTSFVVQITWILVLLIFLQVGILKFGDCPACFICLFSPLFFLRLLRFNWLLTGLCLSFSLFFRFGVQSRIHHYPENVLWIHWWEWIWEQEPIWRPFETRLSTSRWSIDPFLYFIPPGSLRTEVWLAQVQCGCCINITPSPGLTSDTDFQRWNPNLFSLICVIEAQRLTMLRIWGCNMGEQH